MTRETIYNAAKEWSEKNLGMLSDQEVDDIAMVWLAAIDWYNGNLIL